MLSSLFVTIGTLHRFKVGSLYPCNTTLPLRVDSTESCWNVTLHPLSHSCGSARRLWASTGRMYAVCAFHGKFGKSRVTSAVVVILVPLGMVIVFGACLLFLGFPSLLLLINVNDATESKNAVFALSYFVQQGSKCGKVKLLLRATFLNPPGVHRHFGVHSLLTSEPPIMLRRVASLLCPMRSVPHVALVWPFLHLNPWVQQ